MDFAAKFSEGLSYSAFLDKYENADEDNRMSVDYKVQALIETCELQAIHIETLNQRLKALEVK